MPIACFLITHLPLKVELARRPALRDQAALIIGESGAQKVVCDRSPQAHDTVVGMPLDLALARCPHAAIVEADMPAYRETWERVLDGLEQRSPIVQDTELGLAYVDLRGLERLYGNQAKLLKAVLDAAPPGYRPRVGVGGGKFLAYAAALHAEPSRAVRVPEDAASYLAPLPVVRLPASWKVKERLMDFGLLVIGDVAQLPLDAMQGQFGREGARLWRLANGRDDEPVIPRGHAESFRSETAFSTPTASLPAILVGLEALLKRVFSGTLRGRFARVALLEGRVTGRAPWNKRVTFREPVGSANRAQSILKDRLETLVLPGPLETLSLTLTDITGEQGRQESLFWDVRRHAQLDDAVRQLKARLGCQPPIYHIREVEPWSRIPERRRALVAYEP